MKMIILLVLLSLGLILSGCHASNDSQDRLQGIENS